MSENKRYCSHCGHALDDNVRYCNNCGTPVPDEQSMFSEGSMARSAGAEEEGFQVHVNWKLIVTIAVIVVVFIIVMASVSGTYRRPVKKFINAMETYDAKEMLDCYPRFYQDALFELTGLTKKEFIENRQENYMVESEDILEELLSSIGASSLHYSIVDVEDGDEGDITSMRRDDLAPTLEMEISDVPKIRKLKAVTVDVTADAKDGNGEELYSEDMIIYVGQIGLKWYVLDYTSDVW